MGGAILRGYADVAEYKGREILVYNRTEATRKSIAAEFKCVTACDSCEELAEKSEVILLGVKPHMFGEVLSQIAPVCTDDKLVVSMAAGISLAYIEEFLGSSQPVIRIMPNTPALVGEAMTSVSRNGNVSDEMMALAMEIFDAIGRTEEVSEELIHCVIGVSGSSPAYTYMYIDALAQAAEENGMSPEKAKVFAAQAVIGAAKMVLENPETSPEQLRINVCSPGGTTIEAVNKLFENGFMDDVKEAFQAAVNKSKLMTK